MSAFLALRGRAGLHMSPQAAGQRLGGAETGLACPWPCLKSTPAGSAKVVADFVTETPVVSLTQPDDMLWGTDMCESHTGYKKGNTMENETTQPTVEQLQADVKRLEESLDYARNRVTQISERNDYHINNWRVRLHASEAKNERRLEALTSALNDAYGNEAKFDHTHADVQRLILGALRIAKLKGLLSDGSAIADAFDASEVWGTVSSDSDYTHQGLESNEIRERILREVTRTMASIQHHPQDPRFSEVWERATKLAQQHDLCEEYDTIAGELDIPTDHIVEYEGHVDVTFTGYASIPVSGRATRAEIRDGDVAYGQVDTDEVLEHVDRYNVSFEIDETHITTS